MVVAGGAGVPLSTSWPRGGTHPGPSPTAPGSGALHPATNAPRHAANAASDRAARLLGNFEELIPRGRASSTPPTGPDGDAKEWNRARPTAEETDRKGTPVHWVESNSRRRSSLPLLTARYRGPALRHNVRPRVLPPPLRDSSTALRGEERGPAREPASSSRRRPSPAPRSRRVGPGLRRRRGHARPIRVRLPLRHDQRLRDVRDALRRPAMHGRALRARACAAGGELSPRAQEGAPRAHAAAQRARLAARRERGLLVERGRRCLAVGARVRRERARQVARRARSQRRPGEALGVHARGRGALGGLVSGEKRAPPPRRRERRSRREVDGRR